MPEARFIRELFGGVASRYDLLNRALSLGLDRTWRRKLAASLDVQPTDRVLDLCCGTGDVALEIAPRAVCVGCDFAMPMLSLAKQKSEKRGKRIHWTAGDALQLPFPSHCFDAATVAFGMRNLENLEKGLAEIHRVLRTGGTIGIVEFSQPIHRGMRIPYRWYLDGLLPRVGSWVSRREGAYRYLAESIARFPAPEHLYRSLLDAGFRDVSMRPLAGGIVTLHLGHADEKRFDRDPSPERVQPRSKQRSAF